MSIPFRADQVGSLIRPDSVVEYLRAKQAGKPVDNLVRMSSLSTLERDRLQDALGIIKRFRQHLQQHFKLGAL